MSTGMHQDGWRVPLLIDFGDLRAKCDVTLPLWIKTPASTQITSELNGLSVTPNQLAAGEQLLRISLAGTQLIKNTLLAGCLKLRATSETHTIWVTGRVLDEEMRQWVQETIYLVAPSKRKYCSSSGLALGPQLLGGEVGGQSIDPSVYLRREESGLWALFQAVGGGRLCLVNGEPVAAGTRLLLRGGETIELDTLKLAVENNPAPLNLEVDGTVDFGRLSALQGASLRIRNRGRLSWSGVLKANVSWIVVPQANVTCPPQQTIQVPLQVSRDVPGAIGQTIDPTGALQLEGQNEVWSIRALVQIDKREEPVRISLEPKVLDWGSVSHWGTAPVRTLEVVNSGDKQWQGHVQAKVLWLDVTPDVVSCPPKGRATVAVQLNHHAQSLPTFVQKVPAAVQITGEGVTAAALVRVQMQPALQIAPERLNFVVTDRQKLPTFQIQVSNFSAQPWNGVASTPFRWLKVMPSAFTCPSGSSITINVALDESINTNFKKEIVIEELSDAVQIQGEESSYALPARLELQSDAIPSTANANAAALIVPSDPLALSAAPQLDFGVVAAGAQLPARQIRLSNSGAQIVQGRARSNEYFWLEVTPATFTCLPGQEVILTVRLTEDVRNLRPKLYQIADAVLVERNGQQTQIGIHLEVRREAPSVANAIPSPVAMSGVLSTAAQINFDKVDMAAAYLPIQILRVANHSTQAIAGRVRVNDYFWLEVAPATFTCLPSREVILWVRLNEYARNLRPKLYELADALTVEGNGPSQNIGVVVEILRSPPDKPVVAPQGGICVTPAMLNFGAINQQLSPLPAMTLNLQNVGATQWQGSLTSLLPWLDVEPATIGCSPGENSQATARLNQHLLRLHPKPYVIRDAVLLEGMGQRLEVPLRIEVVRV